MTPVDRVLDALAARTGRKPSKNGTGWRSRCPAHDDKVPSLSIGVGDDGRALLKCFAGCATADILAALGLTMRDLMPDNGAGPHRRGPSASRPAAKPAARGPTFPTADAVIASVGFGAPSATFEYRDAAGELVAIVARWDRDGGKEIRPVTRTAGGWRIGAADEPRLLYRLPELVASSGLIYVAEGEGCAEALAASGLTATTSSGGSQAAGKSDWSPLRGRDVVIVPDHDEPGRKYADDVARLAREAGAASVRVVRLADGWPELPDGGDVVDLLARLNGDGDELRRIVEQLAAEAEPVAADDDDAERDETRPGDGDPALVRVADVEPEAVSWLWPGRIALGKLTLLVGDPGLGKSLVTLDLAARVSAGSGWPDRPGQRTEPGGVVLVSAEDDVADTIRPRLDAAGADVSRVVALGGVHAVDERGRAYVAMLDLSRHVAAIERAIQSVPDCRLVIVDPVSAYLGATDSHKNAEVRGVLAGLATLAAKHRVALLTVSHLNKSAGNPAIYRATGSLAFVAAARAAWSVSRDKDDPRRRLMLPVKNNIAPDTGGLAFRVEPRDPGGAPVLEWEPDPVTVSADDALAAERDRGGRTERDDAADWLQDYLADGPKPAGVAMTEARAAGFTQRTIGRAKALAGVRTHKAAFGGGWVWTLADPAEECQPGPEGCHSPEVGILRGKSGENPKNCPKNANYEEVAFFDGPGILRRPAETPFLTPSAEDAQPAMVAGTPDGWTPTAWADELARRAGICVDPDRAAELRAEADRIRAAS